MTVRTEALVIGSGMAGIGQAVALAEAGVDFLILEKSHDIGGTWSENTYPGAACDVESDVYSYSHTRNPDWSSSHAGQPEILDYLRDVVRRHGFLSKIRFGAAVNAARWDESTAQWTVSTEDGTSYVSRYLVLGVGALHIPQTPDLVGTETFRGHSWHSSAWNHDVDLTGKHVALVGLGASGVQIIPHLAERAASVTVFQRSAPWVLPKVEEPAPAWRKRLFRLLPLAQAVHRARIYLRREKRGIGFHHRPEALRAAEPALLDLIARQIDDPRLRDLVTPKFSLGCKRVLFSNDYYATLNRPHVRVVEGSPAELRADKVVDEAGEVHKADVIVYATGFDILGSFDRIEIEGIDGRTLKEAWREGAQTYNGVAVPGFPNLFFLLGPNGVVSYTGVVVNIEAQARYVVRAIRATRSAGAQALVVRQTAIRRFQTGVRDRFVKTIWHSDHCRNWYQNDSPGGTVLWPDSTLRYRWLLRRVRRADFAFLPERES